MTDDVARSENELTGDYVGEIRKQLTEHWSQLTERYRERYGVAVPLLTRQKVNEEAPRQNLRPGTGWWLEIALGIASALRPDLTPKEFQRVFTLVSSGDPTLQLNPQPIEILTAIEALRPPRRQKKTGPPPSGAVDLTQIRRALVAWAASWPPTQQTFADLSLDGLSDRRLRQILRAADTSWEAELRLAEQQRAVSS